MTGARSIVALGGGHGLFATLRAARLLTDDVTAVVTVADDGGSSGRLRAELGVMPPGDLRMAMAALSGADPLGSMWAEVFQHRFGGTGALAGHPVGNLVIAGLMEVLGDSVAALDAAARVLGVTGRVLPMSPIPLTIEADVQGLEDDPRVAHVIRGQVAVATTPGTVRRVRLIPSDPPAVPEAIAAIERADLLILGPGSWFSSVIPHVLVPDLMAAMAETKATKALILNLAPQPDETAGFSAERHVHVLSQHAAHFSVDDILVDAATVSPGPDRDHLERAATLFGARTRYVDVARPGTHIHDETKLAQALATLEGRRTRSRTEAVRWR